MSAPRRAAIYSRFSTDLQNEKSITDQVALCRAHAAREGLTVTACFDDRALSGASTFDRLGLHSMLQAAKSGAFEVIIVEAFDRLSRDMEDLAGLFKRLTFIGVEIRAVFDGAADPIKLGMRAIVAQLQREDGVKKIRRGMAGVVRDQRHAGGRAYGYQPIVGRKGELVIVEQEAEVVRRIFSAYAAGATPREIAASLNADRIPPPRGRRWNASTINGNRARGSGMLFNALYAGEIVWNKVRMVRDPETGRRVSRPNPPAEHQRTSAPHLQIVDTATWEAAQAMKTRRIHVLPHNTRKPKRLLSGLLRCSSCGGGMASLGNDGRGKIRVQCSVHRETGDCDNARRFDLGAIESMVLSGLSERLRDPKYWLEYVREYNAERRRRSAERTSSRTRTEKRAREVGTELARCVEAIVKGIVAPETLRETIANLEAERDRLADDLSSEARDRNVVTLHPAALDRYRADIETLANALHRGSSSGDTALMESVRALIAEVVVLGAPGQPMELDIRGRLDCLLTGSGAFPSGVLRGGSLVAEARYRQSPPRQSGLFTIRCAAAGA